MLVAGRRPYSVAGAALVLVSVSLQGARTTLPASDRIRGETQIDWPPVRMRSIGVVVSILGNRGVEENVERLDASSPEMCDVGPACGGWPIRDTSAPT